MTMTRPFDNPATFAAVLRWAAPLVDDPVRRPDRVLEDLADDLDAAQPQQPVDFLADHGDLVAEVETLRGELAEVSLDRDRWRAAAEHLRGCIRAERDRAEALARRVGGAS